MIQTNNTIAGVARLVIVAVASYYGGPAAGFAAGIASSYLFPGEAPDQYGPRLGDTPQLPSMVGQPIALSFGTTPVTGSVIWAGKFTEHVNQDNKRGKGGTPAQSTTTYSYTRSYAVMFGGRPKQGVLLLRRNGQVKYDVRPQKDGESDDNFKLRLIAAAGFRKNCEFHYGTMSETISPTMEGDLGIGNVPAYISRPYIVLIEEDVTDTNTLPAQWDGIWADHATSHLIEGTEYRNDVLEPWDGGGRGTPENCLNDHEYFGTVSNAWLDNQDQAIAELANHDGHPIASTHSWSSFYGDNDRRRISPLDAVADANSEVLALHYNFPDYYGVAQISETEYATAGNPAFNPGYSYQTLFDLEIAAGSITWVGAGPSGSYVYVSPPPNGLDPPNGFDAGWVPANNCTDVPPGQCAYFPNAGSAFFLSDSLLQVRRVPRAPDNPCRPRCRDPYPLLPENNDYCVIGSIPPNSVDVSGTVFTEKDIGYVKVFGDFRALQSYYIEPDHTIEYPLNPILVAGDPQDIEAFWQNAAAGQDRLVPGKSYTAGFAPAGSAFFPQHQTYAWVRSDSLMYLSDAPITIAAIITELCERGGLLAVDLDVTDLSQLVHGYVMNRNGSTPRSGIEQLRLFARFDLVESGVLSFPLRGRPTIRAFTRDYLGAHYAGQEGPEPVTTSDMEDIELPKNYRFSYFAHERDWSPGMQQAQKLVTKSVQLVDQQAPLALSDDEGASIALYWLLEAYDGRIQFTFDIGPENLDLEPGDCVEVPFGSQVDRVRIEAMQMGLPGCLKITARRDDEQLATISAEGVGGPNPAGFHSITGPTGLLALDVPMLVPDDNDSGYYIAGYGFFPDWRGASVQRSTDDGGTFTQVATVSTSAITGTISTSPEDVDPYRFDRVNVLRVDLNNGELSSITRDQILSGANAFAWQVRDLSTGQTIAWEIAQFMTATLVSGRTYDLEVLTRGRRGTEDFVNLHAAGDLFVLLGPPLARIAGNIAIVGDDVEHRGVTIGTNPDAASVQHFTPHAIALRCFAPCLVRGDRNGDGDLAITWVARTRFGGERWLSGLPIQQLDDLKFDIQVLLGQTVKRTANISGMTWTYTAAMQLADFGNLQELVDIRIYQLNATIGRGEPQEETL